MKDILDFEGFKKQFARAGRIEELKDTLKKMAEGQRQPFLMMAGFLDGHAACQVVGTMLKNGWTLEEAKEAIGLLRQCCEDVFDEIEMTVNDWKKGAAKDGE